MAVVRCPACRVRLQVSSKRAGTRLECPKCGTTVEVSLPQRRPNQSTTQPERSPFDFSDPSPTPVAQEHEEPEARPQTRRQRQPKSTPQTEDENTGLRCYFCGRAILRERHIRRVSYHMGRGLYDVVTACPRCCHEYEANRPEKFPDWLLLLGCIFPPLLIIILPIYLLGNYE
jgi:ribosomal protein S27E